MTLLWPDVPASLFGADPLAPQMNAHVGWVLRRRDVYAYREGYRRGAVLLAERASDREQSVELLLWPIAWLWRHYLELALKETIATGELLESESAGWQWPTGHVLAKLWLKARPHIEKHGDPGAPELTNVAAIIAEFDGLDPDSTGFRYPFTVGGTRSLPTSPEHINAARFDETMQRIATFLEAVRGVQGMALDALREQARDSRD